MKVFENRPMSELVSIVKDSFRKYDQEGLIDEGVIIKTVMYCNDKLGIPLRDIFEVSIDIDEFIADLPLNFEKLFYVAALECSNSGVKNIRNAFDNNIDQDVIYKASLDRGSLGCVDNYKVVIERKGTQVYYNYNTWTQLNVSPSSFSHCHVDCPNKGSHGKYTVEIKDGKITAPFRTGKLYIIYIGNMKDEEGNVLYPFHPLITPYYEWSVKEEILSDIIFNQDDPNGIKLFKLAKSNRVKAWLEAHNFVTNDSSFGQYKASQRKRELEWYNKWFKYFRNDTTYIRRDIL